MRSAKVAFWVLLAVSCAMTLAFLYFGFRADLLEETLERATVILGSLWGLTVMIGGGVYAVDRLTRQKDVDDVNEEGA